MDFHAAVQLAKKVADPKRSDRGYDVVQIRPGEIEVNAGEHGVLVSGVEEATLAASVSATILAQVVGKVRTPSLRTTTRTLVVGGRGSEFKIAFAEPPPPIQVPQGAVATVDVSEAASRALQALPPLASKLGDLACVRLTPQWCAATAGTSVAVVWAGGSPEPVTLAAEALKDLRGAFQAQVANGCWWATIGEVRRWHRTVTTPWPDGSVHQLLGQIRESTEPTAYVHPSVLRDLAERAGLVAASPIDPVRISVSDGEVKLTGGTTHEFEGAAPLLGGDGRWTAGLPWTAIVQHAALLEAVGAEVAYLRFNGPRRPIVLYCTEPVPVEVLLMPAFIG